MRPVTDRFLTAVADSHQLAVQVEVLDAGEVTGDPITTVLDGTVTLDQSAASRGRLDMSVVDDGTFGLVPDDPDHLLAPYGNELRVSRGVRYPDGTDELVALGVFRIDDSEVLDTGDQLTVRVSGLDRSGRVIDARFEEPYEIAQGTNYADAIQDTIEAAIPGLEFNFTATSRTTPKLIAEEGADRWAFCQEMARSLGMALYFDGDGVCVLAPVSTLGGTPAWDLVEGEAGVLVTAGRTWTRQGAFNRVIATGENTGETAPARGVATDDNPLSPTYYYGPFGKVPRFYSSPFITTDAQASDAAYAMLARELGTTQAVNFGALVNPALEPDDLVRVTRARAGIDEGHILDALVVPLTAEAVMTGRTRAVQVVS